MPKAIHVHSLLDGRIYSLPKTCTMAALADMLAVASDAQPATPCTKVPSISNHIGDSKHEASIRDRDSGVFLSDTENLSPVSRPSSIKSLNRSASVKSAAATSERHDSIARRLRRPAELKLGMNATADHSKPKSELELRYDLIRNSQNQNKAALRSPTQLLKDRLNLSPKKTHHEEKSRFFTPPKPMLNGCILPGPAQQMGAFTGSSVRARTEKNQRPAWWCKFDKLVVFDGFEQDIDGEVKFKTRSSKGLTIARRRGETETVVIPMRCAHCQEMLNRTEWKYDIQVCKRGVCWDCRERCRWEMQEEQMLAVEKIEREEAKFEGNKARTDSVLEDSNMQEEELLAKIGIEQQLRTPIETVGGIEERLEDAETIETLKEARV